MEIFTNQNDPIIGWVVIPIFIFLARILDVSIGTIRIIFIGKGYKFIAPLLGFFEVIIWITAAGQIMQNLNNFFYYIAWGAGFSAGTYVGIFIESKLSIGQVIIRVITSYPAYELIEHLKNENYNLTTIDGHGKFSDVKIIFMIINRHEIKNVVKIIKAYNPNAFYSIEDVRFVSREYKNNHQTFLNRFLRIKKIFSNRK